MLILLNCADSLLVSVLSDPLPYALGYLRTLERIVLSDYQLDINREAEQVDLYMNDSYLVS